MAPCPIRPPSPSLASQLMGDLMSSFHTAHIHSNFLINRPWDDGYVRLFFWFGPSSAYRIQRYEEALFARCFCFYISFKAVESSFRACTTKRFNLRMLLCIHYALRVAERFQRILREMSLVFLETVC